eukprot:jgi/Mesvir1/1327/Mv16874-RA.1
MVVGRTGACGGKTRSGGACRRARSGGSKRCALHSGRQARAHRVRGYGARGALESMAETLARFIADPSVHPDSKAGLQEQLNDVLLQMEGMPAEEEELFFPEHADEVVERLTREGEGVRPLPSLTPPEPEEEEVEEEEPELQQVFDLLEYGDLSDADRERLESRKQQLLGGLAPVDAGWGAPPRAGDKRRQRSLPDPRGGPSTRRSASEVFDPRTGRLFRRNSAAPPAGYRDRRLYRTAPRRRSGHTEEEEEALEELLR